MTSEVAEQTTRENRKEETLMAQLSLSEFRAQKQNKPERKRQNSARFQRVANLNSISEGNEDYIVVSPEYHAKSGKQLKLNSIRTAYVSLIEELGLTDVVEVSETWQVAENGEVAIAAVATDEDED
jgi:hypothetical protein